MKELGKLLKQQRLAKKLDFDDIQNETKVQVKYLEAIEEGDEKAFPASVYYKSFVRTYAKYLGLNSETLLQEYEERKKAREEIIDMKEGKESFFVEPVKKVFKKQEVAEVKQEEEPAEKKEVPAKPVKTKIGVDNKKLFLTIAAGVLLLGLFVYLNKSTTSSNNSEVNSVEQVQQAENNANKVAVSSGPVSADKQTLSIEATEGVWLKIEADGKEVFEGVMRAGDKQSWTADNLFNLRIGYAPGVRVYFNGSLVDVTKGAIQDVNTVVLKKQSKI